MTNTSPQNSMRQARVVHNLGGPVRTLLETASEFERRYGVKMDRRTIRNLEKNALKKLRVALGEEQCV